MASNPWEGINLSDVTKIYEGIRTEADRLGRDINRASRETGAAAKAAQTFETRLGAAQREIDTQTRRMSERLGRAGAPGVGGIGGGLTPESTPAMRREYARGLAQQSALMATATEQTKRLASARRDLGKIDQQIGGTRASLRGTTGLQRESVKAELSRLERLRETRQNTVSERSSLLAATQQRLATEQALLATLEAQAATLTRITMLSQQAARASFMANRMLGAGGAANVPALAASRLPSGGGLPPIMLPPQQFRWGQQPPRPALGPGPQPIAMLPTRTGGGTVWRMPPVPPPLRLPEPTPMQRYVAGGGGGIRPASRPLSPGDDLFPSRLGRTGGALRATNDEMRRYGALSTEFIDATRRGAVSISELGWQLTSTASKFGGWLAAGGAIYGMLGLLGNLRDGAVESQSGVEQLGRVVDDLDPSAASARFRELSSTYNLSIADVADASFEMGKAFSDQEGALKATEAVLSAMVVGEMDMATASRYLTSIIHGFNLEASDMNLLMDQANEAQNKFGVNIPQTVAGVAKAAGLMNAAGGDLETTLALVTTISRVTGQTGEVAGTAIARSPNFLRRPSNQATLRDFGVDPLANYPELIDQAFEVARDLNGRQIQELAAAIFGPLYGARSGTALLQNEDFYRRVQHAVAPAQARGSADTERESVLREARQEIAQVGVTLEQIGSVLMDIGAFDAFALGLVTLNEVLTVVRQILEVFNSLPAALRTSVVYFGQLAAAVALMRRFNVGPMIAAGADGEPGQFRAPLVALLTRRNNESFLLEESLIQQDKAFANEARSASQKAFRTSIEKENVQRLIDEDKALRARVTSGAVAMSKPEIDALDARMVALHARLAALNDQELAGMSRTASLQELRAKNAAVRSVITERGGLSAVEVARMEAALGLTRARLDPESAKSLAADPAFQAQVERARQQAQAALLRDPRQVPVQGLMMQAWGAPTPQDPTIRQRPLGMQARTLQDQIELSMGVPMKDLEEEARRGRRMRERLRRFGTRLGAMGRDLGQGLRSFGQGMMGLVNPITVAMAAIAIGITGLQRATQRRDQLEAINARELPESSEDFHAQQKELLEAASGGVTTLGLLTGDMQAVVQARQQFETRSRARNQQLQALLGANSDLIMSVSDATREATLIVQEMSESRMGVAEATARQVLGDIFTLGGVPDLFGLGGWSDMGERIRGEMDDPEKQSEIDRVMDELRQSYIYREDIEEEISRLSRAEREGNLALKEREERVAKILEAIQESDDLSDADREDLTTRVYLTRLSGRGVAGDLQGMRELRGDALAEQITAFATAVQGGFAHIDAEETLLTMVIAQATGLLHSRDPKKAAQGAEALRAYPEALKKNADRELDRALALARGQDERNAAYDRWFEALNPRRVGRMIQSRRAQLGRELIQNRQERGLLEEAGEQRLIAPREDAGGLERLLTTVENLRRGLVREGTSLKGNTQARRRIMRELRLLDELDAETMRELVAARRQRDEAKYQENKTAEAARSAYRQSQTPSGTGRLRETLRAVRAQIQRALQVFRRDSEEVQQLLTEEQSALNALVQEEMSMMEANQRYEEAGFTGQENPIPGMQARLANQRERLDFMRRNPLVFSPADIRNAEADIRQLELEIAETIRKRAEEAEEEAERLIAARSDTRVARLEGRADRVGVAREQLRQSRREYRQADTPLEREEARARLIRSRTNVRDQVFQRELEDIQFGADIGKLTLQQQISQYQQLLKNATLNRDQRRDLRRRIYQLQQEAEQEAGSFDLQVGNIRLPSVYEIRRAIQAGGTEQGPRVVINQHNSYVANGLNTNEFMSQLSAQQERSNRRASSAARSAGVR